MVDKLQFNQGQPAGTQPPAASPVAASTPAAGTPQGQGASQPAGQEPAAGAPAAQPQGKPLTLEDLTRVLDERDRRNRQSQGDQITARVQKEMARLAKAGIAATPDQVQAMMQAEPEPAPASSGAPASGSPAQGQAGTAEPAVHPVVTEAMKMIEAAGLSLDDSPEWEQIDQETEDPVKFKASVAKAIAAISERNASEGKVSNVPGVLNGRGTSQPAHANMSGTETLDSYFSDFFRGVQGR